MRLDGPVCLLRGLMHCYLLAQICVRALMPERLGCARVQGVCVCLVHMCTHWEERKRKRNREAEAGRVWFLVTEKLRGQKELCWFGSGGAGNLALLVL